jgi:chemotaxis regulatin CheY-phosphate phosphatase CheZ
MEAGGGVGTPTQDALAQVDQTGITAAKQLLRRLSIANLTRELTSGRKDNQLDKASEQLIRRRFF